MSWFKKIPRISLLLLVATYGVFGWLYCAWGLELVKKTEIWHQWMTFNFALITLYVLGLVAILTVIIFFTAPITLLTLGMENWFRVDAKAFFAIAISIVLFAIIIEYPVALTRFLILSAAAMLFRFDLQTVGCPQKIAQYILIILSLIAFTTGIAIFYFYGGR